MRSPMYRGLVYHLGTIKTAMSENPLTESRSSRRLATLTYTPFRSASRNPLRTPHLASTPYSRRVVASTRVRHEDEDSEDEEYDYQGLLKTTWKTYSLSPLYGFKTSQACLTKYARSLDCAFSQEKAEGLFTESTGQTKCTLAVYKGLKFNQNDAEAVQILVRERTYSGQGSKQVLSAMLVCVDLDNSPVPPEFSAHFSYFPVILIQGSKTRANLVLNWLERHFDCRSAPVTFSNNDLRWMLATWCSQGTSTDSRQVNLQYSLTDVCEGISTISCQFEADFCKELWDRLNKNSCDQLMVSEKNVNTFVDSLEDHLEYTMHIFFSKLSLSEIGTPLAYVSSEGKLKMFSNSGVFSVLHLICEIVKDKFMEIGYSVVL